MRTKLQCLIFVLAFFLVLPAQAQEKKPDSKKTHVYQGKTVEQWIAALKDKDEDVREAAQAALQGPWGKLSARERGKLMLRLSTLMRENARELEDLEIANVGKPIRDSRDEVALAADCIEYYAGAASFIISAPVEVSPVNEIFLTDLCVTRA